jgi:4-hydroxythreonine-4-phosphate dehydrogenase
MKTAKPLFAITSGDPFGVGPEIILKSLILHPEVSKVCIPVIFGNRQVMEQVAHSVKFTSEIRFIPSLDHIEDREDVLQCYNMGSLSLISKYGQISAEGGRLAYQFLQQAITAAQNKKVQAIITAPINKEAWRQAGVPYQDHTDMLTALTQSTRSMTLFVTGTLRIFFLTRHIPFAEIAGALQINKTVAALQDCQRYLKQIGFEQPHLALAALNPHAGDLGLFGREESEILEPAVRKARQLGILVDGPVPADAVFHLAREGKFDAVLSLYHDQGHIAAKTLDFRRTVSLTLGLPFLRTSVDHGTAFDIAGQGIADETSMVEAILAAHRYYW